MATVTGTYLQGRGRPRQEAHLWQRVGVVIPYVWLLVFFLLPFMIVFKISFADPVIAQPPFTALIDWTRDAAQKIYITFDNYRYLFQDKLYVVTYLNSIKLAAISTLICLLIGYPMAYAITRSRPSVRYILLLMIIGPYWISFLLRVYAWMGILNTRGVLNNFLLWTGVIDQPLNILYTDTAVFLGMVYSYLPFMVLPLYAVLERLNVDLL